MKDKKLADLLVIRNLSERDWIFVVGKGFLELAKPVLNKISSNQRNLATRQHKERLVNPFIEKGQAIGAFRRGFIHRTFLEGRYESGTPVGYAFYDIIQNYERTAYKRIDILCLYVNKKYEREGIGKKLVQEIARRAKELQIPEIELTIPGANDDASHDEKQTTVRASCFYKKLGFRQIGNFCYGCNDLTKILEA